MKLFQNINFKIRSKVLKTFDFLSKFIQLQLFISCISTPILIYWGLPISIVSPIGNLIFSPFLTVFLFLSSLIFFFELINFPNQFLIILLEKVTSIWLWLISYSQKSWLISFYKPPVSILFIIPFIAYLLLHSKKIKTIKLSIIAFTILICSSFFTLHLIKSTTQKKVIKIKNENQKALILSIDNKTILVDFGILKCRGFNLSYIKYDLISNLRKNGINQLDYIIVPSPSINVFKALKILAEKITLKNIYVPWWKYNKNKKVFKVWSELTKTLKQNNTKLYSIKKTLSINFNEEVLKLIVDENKIIKKNNLIYPKIKIENPNLYLNQNQ